MSHTLQTEWLINPEFSLWISGVPGDQFVYCKLCNKDVNLHNGLSSLRSHANGIRHSDLAKAFKKKRNKSLKARPSAHTKPYSHSHGSQTAGVNINFINKPSTSAVPNIHQSVSTLGQKQWYSASSHDTHPSSRMQSSRKFVGERRSSEFIDLDSSSSHDCKPICKCTKDQVKETIVQMFTQQDLMAENDISDILSMYKKSLNSCQYFRIKTIMEHYKSEAKSLRKRTKEELFRFLCNN